MALIVLGKGLEMMLGKGTQQHVQLEHSPADVPDQTLVIDFRNHGGSLVCRGIVTIYEATKST